MPYPFQDLAAARGMQPGGGGFQEQQGGAVPMAQGAPQGWFAANGAQNTGVTGGAPAASGGYTFDPSKANDPNEIRAFINDRVQATKGRPATDEDYSYWLPKIQGAGGLGDGKYWMSRMTDPEGTGSNAGGGGGGGGFGSADVMQQDPGYQFAFQQGIDAVQRGAAAKGTLLTGGTQKELANYAAGLASQRYGDIFNRNLSLADLGLNAASRAAGLGSSYGQQAGQTLTQGGQAAAAGSINQGNIWGNTVGDLGTLGGLYYMNQQNPWMTLRPQTAQAPGAGGAYMGPGTAGFPGDSTSPAYRP